MREKINLASKIKERVLISNNSLISLDKLPSEIYQNLLHFSKNFLLLYKQNIYKPHLEIVSDKEILLFKKESIPDFKVSEVLLLILPFPNVRYIFQCKVKEVNERGYLVEILDPREDERISLSERRPLFISHIPFNYVQKILQDPGYQLLRETNFSLEDLDNLEEAHIYDLILNSSHNIDETFKKLIQKTLLVGEVINLAKGGIAGRFSGTLRFTDEFNIFYLKFELIIKEKVFKFGILSHLKGETVQDGTTSLSFIFIRGLKKEFWDILKEGFKA